jgi:DNA-damage-inducible protein D
LEGNSLKNEVITKLTPSFEEAMRMEDGVEYWMARDLQVLFEYASWNNFVKVIEKAKMACQNSEQSKADHFRDIMKLINIAKGAQKEIPDCQLSRYACYLVAQNGDPRKESIAFAQSYFALQTRKQELLKKHIANVEMRHKLTQTEKALSFNPLPTWRR